MSHNSPERVAELLPEPPDKTVLVVLDLERRPTAIFRDDELAKEWEAAEGDRWFDDNPENDPMSLHQHVQFASAVHQLGDPIARF